VWHASITKIGMIVGNKIMHAPVGVDHEDRARRVLNGVGIPGTDMVERTTKAVHLRRLCNQSEIEHGGLVLRDVRGTNEEALRLAPVAHLLPPGYQE
jgi:hypothetical protein